MSRSAERLSIDAIVRNRFASDARRSPAYRKGFRYGVCEYHGLRGRGPAMTCPYPIDSAAAADWFAGHDDARMRLRAGVAT